jgi:hypothetical protein
MRGFNEKLFGDKLVAGQLPTQLGLIGSTDFGFDADAQAFFDRVTAATGTLSNTEKLAVDTLVRQMKLDGIWSLMKAIYPMVGASAAACSQNLKSSSFTGSFSTGWTFASTGVTPNGTSAYMDTTFNTNTNQSVNNFSLSVYIRSASTAGQRADMGNANSPTFLPLTTLESNTTMRSQFSWDFTLGGGRANITTTDSRGMWGVSRSGATSWQSFERNTSVSKTTSTTQTVLPNLNIYIGATNINTGAYQFSDRQIAFAHLGDKLSNTEFNNFYTAVQAFQTTLSRQV